jgi:hypothetical protein
MTVSSRIDPIQYIHFTEVRMVEFELFRKWGASFLSVIAHETASRLT